MRTSWPCDLHSRWVTWYWAGEGVKWQRNAIRLQWWALTTSNVV